MAPSNVVILITRVSFIFKFGAKFNLQRPPEVTHAGYGFVAGLLFIIVSKGENSGSRHSI
jgi:hypothetical protein